MNLRVTFSAFALVSVLGHAWIMPGALAETRPALPDIPDIGCLTASGATSHALIRVPAGGDFQHAINAAKPGDTILLEAGAVFTGRFTFPHKQGFGCIIVRSSAPDSALPAAGERTDPSYAPAMPKIVPLPGAPLSFAPGSHHYLIMHVEIHPTTYVDTLVEVGTGRENTLNLLPHHIEFDRVYIHGHPTQGTKRGIGLQGAAVTVKNSYIADIKTNGLDTQAICGWNGSGPFRITNNYLEAAGENVMFGGADPWIQDLVPSDIEIRKNTFAKPLAWRQGDPHYAGVIYTIKNLLEFKNARRVLIDGNVFENVWPHAQAGFAVLFTPKNDQGTCTWCTVEDMTMTSNVVRQAAQGISVTAFGWPNPTRQASRILIQNNLFQNIGAFFEGHPAYLFQIITSPQDLIIKNNTAFHSGRIIYVETGPIYGFVFDDNVTNFGVLGINGAGGGGGTGTLEMFFPGYDFRKNVIIGVPGNLQVKYPSNNFYPASNTDVGFVDAANGNYRLSASSPYKKAGTNSKDPGVDFDQLTASQGIGPILTNTVNQSVGPNIRTQRLGSEQEEASVR